MRCAMRQAARCIRVVSVNSRAAVGHCFRVPLPVDFHFVKRWAFKLAMFVFAGAIINIAVAWGCSTWIGFAPGSGRAAFYHGASRAFVSSERWQRRGHVRQDFQFAYLLPYERFGTDPLDDPDFRAALEGNFIRFEVRAGWPQLSVRCYRTAAGATYIGDTMVSETLPANVDVIGDIPRSPRAGTVPALRFAGLPCVPIWPGFAINTMFYAAIVWLCVAAPLVIRRWRRVRQRRCTDCGYPIGESAVCTECGTAVKPIPVEADA